MRGHVPAVRENLYDNVVSVQAFTIEPHLMLRREMINKLETE